MVTGYVTITAREGLRLFGISENYTIDETIKKLLTYWGTL